jgi:hypothetical protein
MCHKSTRVIWIPSDLPMWDDDARPALILTQAAHDLLAEDSDDEFAFACPGCLRPLVYCSCLLSEK